MYYKGIVIDINDKFAIVMINSGEVIKIKLKGKLSVGDTIMFTEKDTVKDKNVSQFKNKKLIIPIVTAALICLIVTFNVTSKYINNILTPYALVTLDINPSIGLEVDEENIVLNAKGLNNDGNKINIDELKGKSLNDATKILKDYIENNKEIKNKDSMIVGFAFLNNKEDKTFEENVQNTIRKNFNGVEIVYMHGTKEDSKIATDKGISLGRYKADEEIEDDLEDQIESMSVDELIKLLKKKGNPVYLNEEIRDELEDRYEDLNEKDDDEKDDKSDKDDENEKDNDKEENNRDDH